MRESSLRIATASALYHPCFRAFLLGRSCDVEARPALVEGVFLSMVTLSFFGIDRNGDRIRVQLGKHALTSGSGASPKALPILSGRHASPPFKGMEESAEFSVS